MEYFSGDSEDDMSDSEIKDCEEKCYSELLKGVHLIRNKDGTLRCPFCKGKKKQDYKYKDLLQHASGVGAGKRGVEATGGHRALEKFLKSHFTDAAEPPIQRTVHLEQEAPQRPNAEELIVWPWMGIIVNINRTMVDGKYVGAGNSELKERFAGFHPIQVHALWSYEGHLGKAILEFSKDWKGYNEAISFERSFVENHHSRKEYYGRDPGSELYGWVARSFTSSTGAGLYSSGYISSFPLPCAQPRQRNSDSESRFPPSPSDPCQSADLRRAALLRSLQMRAHPPVMPSFEMSVDNISEQGMHHIEESEDQSSPFVKSLTEHDECSFGSTANEIFSAQTIRSSGRVRSLLLDECTLNSSVSIAELSTSLQQEGKITGISCTNEDSCYTNMNSKNTTGDVASNAKDL